MISWWVNTLVCYFYFIEQTFVWVLPSASCSFCSHFSKLLWTNVLFQLSLLYDLTPPFCLLFACFLQFVFFSKYFKYVVLLGVSYRTWNSTLVTFFANKDDYSINKEWRQKMTLFRLQKETSCLKVNK